METHEPASFGERLRILRSEKNLNQAELGEKLGEVIGIERISSSAIGSYERNEREPNYTFLRAMADYFGVSFDYLLCRSNERITVEEFTQLKTFELEEVFNKFNITHAGETISRENEQRILDFTSGLLWRD